MSTQTPTSTATARYVLPATVASNLPHFPRPGERGIFAAARGILLEASAQLGGHPTRLVYRDNRGIFADRHIDVVLHASIDLAGDPAGRGDYELTCIVLVTVTWGFGGAGPDRDYWSVSVDRHLGRGGPHPGAGTWWTSTDHRHLAGADGPLPAPAHIGHLVAAAHTAW